MHKDEILDNLMKITHQPFFGFCEPGRRKNG